LKEFVHLHLHSQYSLLDGAIKIGDLVRKVAGMGMPAVALTDHGGMIGTVDFYEKANREGIKPIIGAEVYVTPGSRHDRSAPPGEERSHHLILLAESDEGYRNLIRLVSHAHVEGFYYRPRVDKEILREFSRGIISTSACLQGEIPVLLAREGKKRAAEAVEEYKEIFPDGRFFLEIQDNGLTAQNKANPEIIDLARSTETPLVATNDCHYLERKDARVHDILLCLQTGKVIGAADRMRFETDQFYVKAPEEFERAFGHVAPDALKNTVAIAERCLVKLDLGQNKIPEFQVPEGMTSDQYLRKLATDGLLRRFQEMRTRSGKTGPEAEENYRKRLEYELKVIENTGFSGYFLIVWDFIRFAKEQGIPVGPGRGSAAGSLVAYCLKITEVDPLTYGLLFERFLNPERISLPDIDCDFCKDRRDEVIRYVEDRYGKENVAQIITFGTMKARAAVRDVGRVLEMPYADVDTIAKLIPADLGMTIEKALAVEPRLQEMIGGNPKVADLFEYAKGIEGLSRHASTHAAGVVIANRPITEYVPLYRNSNGDITTQFPMQHIEKVGLVKFDFLGLRTLTAIHNTRQLIRERRGEEVDVDTLSLSDPETYEMLSRGDTAGVFQCESQGFTDLLLRLKADRFTHLIDAVALYRPGPLQSGMVDDFIARRHAHKTIEYLLPELEEILRDTYGVIVYQEQVMQIAVALGGFSMGEADVLRKAMGKKDPVLMEKQKIRFLEGAKGKGISGRKAAAIFDLMAQFGEYGFNKSHSAAYALLAYQTAYLKTHYPVEFFCALMTSESGDTAKIIRYMAYCRERGIPVLPPDVNESRFAFHPSGQAIRFGGPSQGKQESGRESCQGGGSGLPRTRPRGIVRETSVADGSRSGSSAKAGIRPVRPLRGIHRNPFRAGTGENTFPSHLEQTGKAGTRAGGARILHHRSSAGRIPWGDRALREYRLVAGAFDGFGHGGKNRGDHQFPSPEDDETGQEDGLSSIGGPGGRPRSNRIPGSLPAKPGCPFLRGTGVPRRAGGSGRQDRKGHCDGDLPDGKRPGTACPVRPFPDLHRQDDTCRHPRPAKDARAERRGEKGISAPRARRGIRSSSRPAG
jgi:DNA polymerase-3 subunit alpha